MIDTAAAGRSDSPHGASTVARRGAANGARLRTRLTDRFELDHPVIQAPMALAAGGRLAASVTAAGGLGLIGGGYGDAGWLDEQFTRAGNAPVGCGFITWSLGREPALLERVLDRSSRAIFLSFGDPAPYAARIHDAGAALICQVQTLRDARRALEIGADVVVAQGSEAGGHGERRATLTLVPETADLIARESPETLLCAAGGIADGRGLAAALALGADGVVVGSRFWASEEAIAPRGLLDAACAAGGDDTLRTHAMDIVRARDWPARYTARVIANAFTDRWHTDPDGLQAALDVEGARWSEAWERGDAGVANAFVGEGAGLIGSVEPARVILERMVGEAVTVLRAGTAMIVD